MKHYTLVLLCSLLSTPALAIDYTSAATGDWSVGANWNPVGVPGVGDTVTILAAHRINIDGNITIGTSPAIDTYDVDIAGTLAWPSNPAANWTLTLNTSVRISSGGEFRILGDCHA